MKNTWKPTGYGNFVLDNGNGKYFVSYNPNTNFTHLPMFAGDSPNGDETALVDCETGKYFVLNGDFRKDFEAAFLNGFAACKSVYNKYKSVSQSVWTDDYEEDQ